MTNSNNDITIYSDLVNQRDKTLQLAQRLALPISKIRTNDKPQLLVLENHIAMSAPSLGNPIWIDFAQGKNAHRRRFGGGRGQALAKAIGLKKGATPTVIDATAGYGQDAYVLATLGCNIALIERNPILATLLEDAINRAQTNEETQTIAQRMELIHHNSPDFLNQLLPEQYPDVIYIDPMYPSRQKTALVKKEMQLLHQLIGPDTDSEELLKAARKVANKRVVVKRPKSAPTIDQQKPSTAVESKNTRYDIYI
ncbi:MAG: class I SAM-dependent methyltransferase [Gammaproteobacteria bacterium]|mgnify:CR=1 FL=1|jgi:16S rRNA (guanine1516-N2)-methyltransferase|nr:class I SAM-dependent methyltransferase [Gammaproteobacteria bacterium]